MPPSGHSCVNAVPSRRLRRRLKPTMFWKTRASWLKASSTRNELSVICKRFRLGAEAGRSRGGDGVCAAAEVASLSMNSTTASTCTSSFEAARVPIVSARSSPPSHADAVGDRVSRLDLDLLPRLELTLLEKAQKRRILIGHARDGQRHAAGTSAGSATRCSGRRLRRPGIGSPCGSTCGCPSISSIRSISRSDTTCSSCSASSCTSAQLMPITAPETARPADGGAAPLPARRSPAGSRRTPTIGLVLDQSRFSQRLDHRGRGARRDAHRRGQLAHAAPAGRVCQRKLLQMNGFEVVLDGARRQHSVDF